MVDIPRTLGALLIGGIIASMFSAVVIVQCLVYFKFYPKDPVQNKVLVCGVGFLDASHTIFIILALWDHLITHFGDVANIYIVPWSLALTIALTAIMTFLVQLFFVHRIYKLSGNNLFIALPLAFIACARLGFACLTTNKMIALQSLHRFVALYGWSFTAGLALSSLLDVLITGLVCYLLMLNQREDSSMKHVLDTLILYTFENGSLTCAATIVSLICWLMMNNNFIFLGLHVIISKFYANSLLATLNTRMHLNSIGSRTVGAPDKLSKSRRFIPFAGLAGNAPLRIQVRKTSMVSVSDNASCPVTHPTPRPASSDDSSVIVID